MLIFGGSLWLVWRYLRLELIVVWLTDFSNFRVLTFSLGSLDSQIWMLIFHSSVWTTQYEVGNPKCVLPCYFWISLKKQWGLDIGLELYCDAKLLNNFVLYNIKVSWNQNLSRCLRMNWIGVAYATLVLDELSLLPRDWKILQFEDSGDYGDRYWVMAF